MRTPRSQRWRVTWLLCWGLAVAPALTAQERAGSPAASSVAPGSGTLATLAHQLGTRLAPSAPLWVVMGPVTLVPGATIDKDQLGRLHERLRVVVGSAVTSVEAREREPLDAASARRLARKSGHTLLYLAPSLVGGQLLLSVDLVAFPREFWQRARQPEGVVAQHLALSAPIDAEIRSFLPRPRALLEKRAAFSAPFADVLSLSCGATSNGALDLVVVGRRELVRGRFVGEAFVTLARRSWNDLSPIAATPLRAPLAAAHHRSDGVLIGASDRAHLVLLDESLGLVAHGPRAWPLGDDRCAPFTESGVARNESGCALVEPRALVKSRPNEPTAKLASALRLERGWADSAGIAARFSLSQPVDGGETELVVRSPLRADNAFHFPSGSAAALDDLDGDGRIELLTSSPSAPGAADGLRVTSYDGTAWVPRAELPFAAIEALTICPFDGENPLLVVVASAGQLWVLS